MAGLPPLPPGFTLDQPQSTNASQQSLPPLPPGFTLDQPGQQQPAQKPLGTASDAFNEPVMNMVTGLAGSAIGGLAGIGKGIYTGIKTGSLDAGLNAGADTVNSVSNALTYQPRTRAGELGTTVATAPFRAIDYLTDKGGDLARQGAQFLGASPEVSGGIGAAVKTGLNLAPAGILKGRAKAGVVAEDVRPSVSPPDTAAPARAPSAPAEVPTQAQRPSGLESVPTPENPTLQLARDAGYKLKPSETGKAPVGTAVEGLTGSAKLETSLAVKNQRRTNELVQEELGLPKGNISPESLQALKAPYNGVYEKVKRLGEVKTDETFVNDVNSIGRTPGTSFSKDTNPAVEKLRDAYADEPRFNSADAVLKIRTLRNKGNLNIKSRDPELQELGYAQREVANAIEGQIERHVEDSGNKDLIERFRNARQQLAKINTVEGALKGGDISAPILAKMLDRGAPLSGNLKTIAEVAQTFPNVMREGRKLKNKSSVNMYESTLGVAGMLTANPALAVGMVARPITRAVLTSDIYQNSLARRSGVSRSAPKKTSPKLTTPKRNKLAEF